MEVEVQIMLMNKKNDRIFEILASPDEEVKKGEYLLIEDVNRDFKVLVQVLDIDFFRIYVEILPIMLPIAALLGFLTYISSTFLIPATMFIITGTKAITKIMKIVDASPIPNKRIAIGIHAKPGISWRMYIKGIMILCQRSERLMNVLKIIPEIVPNIKPVPHRNKLAMRCP